MIKINVSIFFFLLFSAFSAVGQFKLIPLEHDFNRTEKVQSLANARPVSDTNRVTYLPFFDDFSGSNINPDPRKWFPSQGTYVNNTYCLKQKTKNVASFDGLNSKGVPYSSIKSAKGVADKLTSRYIDLSKAYSDCSIPTLVFFWQCGGMGEPPDPTEGDSLVVQFKDSLGNWVVQWSSLAITKNDTFYMAKVPVNDPVFYHFGFQFRFYSKGTLAGAYDVWNLDYVSLTRMARQDLKSIYFTDDLNGWAVGSCGAILKTEDGGVTWKTKYDLDSTVHLNSLCFSDANNGIAVGDNGKIALYRNEKWVAGASGVSENLNCVSLTAQNKSVGWAVGNNGRILKTNDAGSTWSTQSSTISTNLNSVASSDVNTAIAVGAAGRVVYSTDGGANWTLQDSISNPDINTNLNSIAYINATKFVIAGDNGVILSASVPGMLWQQDPTSTSNNLYALNFVGLDTAWAMGIAGSNVVSLDKGSRWTNFRPFGKFKINSIYSNTINKMWLCGSNNLLAIYDKTKNTWKSNSSSVNTYFPDRAYAMQPNSFLKNYNAMPIKQFLANQANETNDTLKTNIFNLDSIPNFTYVSGNISTIVSKATTSSFDFLPSVRNYLTEQTFFPLAQYLDPASITMDPSNFYKVKTTYTLDANDIGDYRVNDTISVINDLSNYYAYDDGSAEFSIITNQQFGKSALKFVLNTTDTLTAIDIYFTQIVKNLSNVTFNLYVWKSLQNDLNAPSLFNNVGAASTVKYGDSLNRFYRYKLTTYNGNDTSLVVSDTIFIGYRQITGDNLTLGFDMNTNSSQHMFYETNGTWSKYIDQPDYFPGSLMIRPVFGQKGLLTSISDNYKNEAQSLNIFPNPSNGILNFTSRPNRIEIFDITGKIVWSKSDIAGNTISLEDLSDGIYILKWFGENGKSVSKRLIIQK